MNEISGSILPSLLSGGYGDLQQLGSPPYWNQQYHGPRRDRHEDPYARLMHSPYLNLAASHHNGYIVSSDQWVPILDWIQYPFVG